MGSEEITIKSQWSVTETLRELDELEAAVTRFLEHTAMTLSQRRKYDTPFGSVFDEEAEMEHPIGHFLGSIKQLRGACYKRYGQEQYESAAELQMRFDIEEPHG